jgi:hypothetical protein
LRVKVYLSGDRQRFGEHTVFVAPGNDPVGISGGVCDEWLEPGGKPRTIAVQFNHGLATVPDNLGRYLVARGLARRTRLIIPDGVAA